MSAPRYIYTVRLRTQSGLAGAHFVQADHYEVTASGAHVFHLDGRMVWRGAGATVTQVVRCENLADAQTWHRRNLRQLVSEELEYGTGVTGDGSSPYIGDVKVLVNRSS